MSAKKKKNYKKNKKVEATLNEAIPAAPVSKPIIKAPAWLPLVFIGLAFVLYFQCLPYGYVLDDKIVFSENNYTKNGLAGIKDIMTKETFQGYFGEQKDLVEGGRYRPLSLVTFAIEHQFVGLTPEVSHGINIFLYGICAWLVFLVMSQLTTGMNFNSKNQTWWWTIAFLTAIIYLVHPVHTEAIANIKGRDEIMAMIFALLTMRSCIKYAESDSIKHLVFASIFYVLGVLSKENVITFLAVTPLALWMFKKGKRKHNVIATVTLLVLTIIYLFTRAKIIGYIVGGKEITDIMNNPFYGMTATETFGSISYTMYEYLRLSFIPHPLTHDYYPYHIPKVGFGHWKVVMAIVMHLALFVYSILAFKKHKIISFGIWFYIITISIVSNIVVGVGTFMNERFIFISSMGMCMIIAYLLKKAANKWSPEIAYIIAATLVLLFGIKTISRVPAWESALSLNKAAVKVSLNSARANSFMATALFEEFNVTEGREEKLRLLNEAEIYADRALNVHPTYNNGNLMKAGIEAELFKLNGDLDALLQTFREVGSVQPQIGFLTEYCRYLNDSRDPGKLLDFYHDLGYNRLYLTKRNSQWAVHYLKLGYELNSGDPKIKKALFDIYTAVGNSQEAQKYR